MKTLSPKTRKAEPAIHIRMSKELKRQVTVLAELWGESITGTVTRCVQICYSDTKRAAGVKGLP
jgi:hypothetical protein